MAESKLLFVSYSHKDQHWLDELRKWIEPLEDQGLLKIWDDSQIMAGDIWKDKIEEALAAAGAALLLVSQDFLASDFIDNDELPSLLEKAEQEGLNVFWIALSASTVQYSHPEITKFQAVHHDPPLDQLDPGQQTQAFLGIFKKIKEVMET